MKARDVNEVSEPFRVPNPDLGLNPLIYKRLTKEGGRKASPFSLAYTLNRS
jgi:hypothetical protein